MNTKKKSRETAIYKTIGYPFIYPTLGLAGEVGEVVEKIKKVARNDDGVFSDETRADIEKELGDVLWYVAQIATELSLALEDIADKNIKKLESRKNRGVLHSQGDSR